LVCTQENVPADVFEPELLDHLLEPCS